MASLVDKYFSKIDLDAIEAAVKKAESTTSGEIVVQLASHSRNWLLERTIWALVLGAIVGVATLFLTRENDWGMYYNTSQALLWGGIAFVVVYFAGGRLLKRTARRQKIVWDRAVGLFKKLTPARGLAGVLVFLSLDEDQAAIVADKGIASKLPPDYWQQPADALDAAMKAGKHAEGVIAAIETIAVQLAEHFPGGADDSNDLPNRPQTID